VWRFDIGTGSNGWGNNELEYYREENTSVENGLLVIEARKETFGGRAYTSSRIKTEDNFAFTYGRVDVRAVVAEGKGLWSAVWMLGQSFADISWPYSGEIDIVDTIGGPGNEDTAVHNVYWNGGGLSASYNPVSAGTNHQLSSGQTYSDSFHVFSIEWSADEIVWYVDDVQTHSVSIADGSDRAEAFRNDFFLILNVAVGGNWPGAPVSSTQFPRGMLVDYVRVFQLTP
jgi:beta-glucanase (GH16 family)